MKLSLSACAICVIGMVITLVVVEPTAWCATGEWTIQPDEKAGSCSTQKCSRNYLGVCGQEPSHTTNSFGNAHADLVGCPGNSFAFTSGIVYAKLMWTGGGKPPPRVYVHLDAQCDWWSNNWTSGNPPSCASGSLRSSFADHSETYTTSGSVHEMLRGDHSFWADVGSDGTVTAAVSFTADANDSGSPLTSGRISVSAGIVSFDAVANQPTPPANASASWKASSMSYWPQNPCFSPIKGAAKSGGDPVNLANGRHEYLPEPDISVYNPNGPRVSYIRNFEGYEADLGLGSPGLSSGWMHNYDVGIIPEETTPPTWYKLNLAYPTGARESLIPVVNAQHNPTDEFTEEIGTPYIVTGEHSNTVGKWNWIKVTWKDHTTWTFTPALGACYKLTRIADTLGAYVNVVRDSSNGYRITSVTDNASPANTLLTFSYGAGGMLSSISDAYGRKVVYSFAGGDLASVSQIVYVGDGSFSARETYDYYQIGVSPASHLREVRRPSPTGSETSFLRAIYDVATCKVERIVDTNNNATEFEYYANATRVRAKNSEGQIVKEWIENYNPSLGYVNIGTTDAIGNSTYKEFEDTNNPTSPTMVMDRVGKSAHMVYDQYGNTTKVTSPRGVETVYTYDYPGDALPSEFAFGRLVSVQVGTLTPTTFTYYEPSGLVHTIISPKPGTTDGSTVTSTFTYDALGNILTKTIPASSDTGTMTTTYNYTTDGAYGQPAKIGQPLTVTDNLGHVTHFRYDARGNVISATDALGHETNFTYNIADQLVSTTYPAAVP